MSVEKECRSEKINVTQPSLIVIYLIEIVHILKPPPKQKGLKKFVGHAIEEAPLFSFRKHKAVQASMTLEAALVLPLFLFFFLNLLSIMEIYSLHSTLLASLRETGREMAVYAYAYDAIVDEEDDTGLEALVENMAFSQLYVKSRVGVREDISYLNSSIMQQGDIIDLVAVYKVSPMISIVGFQPSWFYTRYYGRAWTGYDVNGARESAEQTEWVYVTESGEVYHLRADCTYLELDIRSADAGTLSALRNESGGRYYPCGICKPAAQGVVYVTATGDRYHESLACRTLSRTVRQVERAEAEKQYRLCSRCGK